MLADLSRRKKTNAVFGIFKMHSKDNDIWYCTECFGDPSKDLYRRQCGVVNYNSYITTSLVQHCKKYRQIIFNKFNEYIKGASKNKKQKIKMKESKSNKKLKASSILSLTRTIIDINNISNPSLMISSYIETTKLYPMNSEIQQMYEKRLCLMTTNVLTLFLLCKKCILLQPYWHVGSQDKWDFTIKTNKDIVICHAW